MTTLYLHYTYYEEDVSTCYSEEEALGRDEYRETQLHWDLKKASLTRDDSFYRTTEEVVLEEEISPGDTVHVVVVRYHDGGTFAYTYGYWSIQGVYKDLQKALDQQNAIYQAPSPWQGYFMAFSHCDVFSLIVE